jgi:uncharacterized protein involved in type VI secretion and phage assembly
MLDLLKDAQLRRRQIHGVALGIVVNNRDTSGMERVKVRFPWRDDKDESYWARIATTMAGKNRGTYFLPEVGDEVLVAFDHGEIHHPYVVGALWNGKDIPPERNRDGKNNIRKIRSRSGHEIILDDNHSEKKEKVIVRTNGGHHIILDDSAGAEKIDIRDKTKNNLIVMDSVQNTITIQSQMRIRLKSSIIEIEADTDMTIKAGATLTIQGALVKIN